MGQDGKLTKEAAGYIVCNCLMKIIELFVSTFLVAYLLTISNGNMFNVAMYYIMQYIALGIFYSLFSCFLHKGNKVYFYRSSILLKCIFLMCIAFLKENVADYIIPIALFYGLSSGVYWSSYNVMMNEAISSKSIQKFYGIYNICGYIVSIVAPIALGSVIDAGSFVTTAIYAFIVCLLLFFTTFLLVSRKEEGDKIDFKGLVETIKESKQGKAFLSCYLMMLVNGLRTGTGTLITILIVLTFNSNVSLGSLSSIMSVIAIAVTFLFMKKYDSKKAKIIFLCILLCVFGVGGIIFDVIKPTIVAFNVLYTIAMIVPDNLNSQRRMGMVRVTRKLKYALEHNVLAEVFLNVGRVISYVVILVASFSNSLSIYKILLVINLVFICLYCLIVYIVEKKYSSILLKNDIVNHLKEVEDDCVGYYHYKGELKKVLEHKKDSDIIKIKVMNGLEKVFVKKVDEYIYKIENKTITLDDVDSLLVSLEGVNNSKNEDVCAKKRVLLEKIKQSRFTLNLIAQKFNCDIDEIYVGNISIQNTGHNEDVYPEGFPYAVVLGDIDFNHLFDLFNNQGDTRTFKQIDMKKLKMVLGNASFIRSKDANLDNLVWIGGNASFGGCWSKLGIKYIGGNADFTNVRLSDLSSLVYVGGNFECCSPNVEDLSNLTTVGGNIDCRYSEIGSLPSLKFIGGNVVGFPDKIKKLPNLEKIKGKIKYSECSFALIAYLLMKFKKTNNGYCRKTSMKK